MIAIVDYGVGNLFSLRSSFAMIGQDVKVTSDRAELLAADRLILPGVGAFDDAAESLRASELDRAVLDFAATGKPLSMLIFTGIVWAVRRVGKLLTHKK